MKSLALKIGICLAIIYSTGFLWLPARARIVLYTFGAEQELLLKGHDSSRHATKVCLEARDFDGCWDRAKADYLAGRQ